MTFTIAFLEAGSVFVAVCLLIAARSHPSLLDGIGIPAVLAPALSVSLCCLVSFYYNDLFETRALRDLKGVAPRLLQSSGVTFLAMGVAYAVVPGAEEMSAPFLISMLLLAAGLIVPLRALSPRLTARELAG